MRPFLFFVVTGILLGQPYVVAHRGGAAERPENTTPAFEHAVQVGARMLEFDMGVTSDNRIVIHHDTAVNGNICVSPTVNPGPIRTLSLAQILTFDCGSKVLPNLPQRQTAPGVKMPTLEELLGAFRKNGKVEFLAETKMAIEGTPGYVAPEPFVKLVLEIVRKYKVEDRFILQSGDYRTIDEMRRLEPRVRLCLLNSRRFKPDYVDTAAKHKAQYLMLKYDDVTLADVKAIKAAGIRVLSSTANDPKDWPVYVRMGFEGVLTDAPGALMEFLKSGR